MKHIKNYINERLHITSKQRYSCKPRSKKQLKEIIIQRIKEDGPECDLNDINVSNIKDMSHLFDATDACSGYDGNPIFETFNGDISLWDVSNVTNMSFMFIKCEKFNCDLSQWNVSNVRNMKAMFNWCIKFNCDISKWNVSNVENMWCMFHMCRNFNCDLSRWNVSNVERMDYMFDGCKNFRQDLDEWDVSKDANLYDAFSGCPTKPEWYRQ